MLNPKQSPLLVVIFQIASLTTCPDPEKVIGIFINAGLDPIKNQQATKPVFNVGSSSAHQRWRADNGPYLVVFGSSQLLG